MTKKYIIEQKWELQNSRGPATIDVNPLSELLITEIIKKVTVFYGKRGKFTVSVVIRRLDPPVEILQASREPRAQLHDPHPEDLLVFYDSQWCSGF